jgi:hypothetical protein
MGFLTVLIIVATLGTIATLVLGLWSMVYGDGESGRFDSEHWMVYRIILQGIVLLALVATFFVHT